MYQGIHHDAEEAEFSLAESCACQADKWHGSDVLYSWCRTQPPRAFHFFSEGGAREGPPGCQIPSRPWCTRCGWRPKSSTKPFQVRVETAKAGSGLNYAREGLRCRGVTARLRGKGLLILGFMIN